MNPNRGGEQPAPSFEVLPSVGAEQPADNAEKTFEAPRTPESSPSRQQSPPILTTAPPVTVFNQPATTAIPGDDNSTAKTQTVKEDSGFEKQWIEKAKSIIAQTKDDPFAQKNEMSKVKAAYIEKRFNKKLRTDDAKA